MSEKRMIFRTPGVQAILAGNMTQTRRPLEPQPKLDESGMWHWKDCQWMDGGIGFPVSGVEDYAPYNPGDVIGVREAWARIYRDQFGQLHSSDKVLYKADGCSLNT